MNSTKKAAFGASITLFLAGLLAFSACTNVFAPPRAAARKGVTISIGGNIDARTLLPNAEFTRYTLDFAHVSAFHAQVELTNGQTAVLLTDLANGLWTITAKAYVQIDFPNDDPGEGPVNVEVATGTESVTVSNGNADPVTIELSAPPMGNGDGYLSWNFVIPDDPGITSAGATITSLPDNISLGNPLDLLSNPANRSGMVTLPAGYYLVRMYVQNGYQRIGHTEVAAVYTGLETKAEYLFTGDDFTPVTAFGGTVTLTNTTGVNSIIIRAAKRDQYNNTPFPGQSFVEVIAGDSTYNWGSIYIPDVYTNSAIAFDVEVSYTDERWLNPYQVYTFMPGPMAEPQSINLGSVNLGTVTIGGTIHFTGIPSSVDPNSPSNININISGQIANNSFFSPVELGAITNSEADGTWSMLLPANLAGSQISLAVDIWTGENSVYRDLGPVTIPSTDTTNLQMSVDMAPITWSGTVTVSINGSPATSADDLYIYASERVSSSSSGGNGGGPSAGMGSIPFGMSPVDNNGNWSITLLEPFTGTKNIVFHLQQQWSGVILKELTETLTATTQSNINLGSHSFITLSGTVEVTLNGNSSGGNSGGSTDPGNPGGSGNSSEDTGNSPRVFGNSSQNTESSEKDEGSKNSEDPGNPGNGESYLSVTVLAYLTDDYTGSPIGSAQAENGTWTMYVESSATPRNVYFAVEVWDQMTGRSSFKGTGVPPQSVSSSPVNNINLGTIAFNLITLSGTITGTLNGQDLPSEYQIIAYYIANENLILGSAYYYAESNGQGSNADWSMEIDALDSSKTVSFILAVPINESFYTYFRLSPTSQVFDTDVSGINFTGLALTTKTLQVTITSNGTTQAPGYIYVCNREVTSADMEEEDPNAELALITTTGNSKNDEPQAVWSLPVPNDTGNVYFLVITENAGNVSYYASASPVPSSGPVTLNISTMTPLNMTQLN